VINLMGEFFGYLMFVGIVFVVLAIYTKLKGWADDDPARGVKPKRH